MKVKIDGIGELRFSFQHRAAKTGTVCKCEFDGEAYFAASEIACDKDGNRVDRFRKDKGRRVSLARLLKRVSAMAFTREQRTQIWAAYFKVHSDLKGGK